MKLATKVTSKGQVVIPKPLRDRLRWRAGTRLTVEEKADGSVSLAPVADELDPVAALHGSLRGGPDLLTEFEQERRAEREREEEKWRRFDDWAEKMKRKRRRRRG